MVASEEFCALAVCNPVINRIEISMSFIGPVPSSDHRSVAASPQVRVKQSTLGFEDCHIMKMYHYRFGA